MPFPLAHPAAVLPLRRCCPRYFSLPALVIGSLSPDVGYFCDAGNFSHRLLAGSFGFCLPVGLVCVLVFYGGRWPVVGILPASYRRVFVPLCQRPAGNPFQIVISLLIGAWTHLLLDSITHPDGWLARRLPVLLAPVLLVGQHRFMACDILYAGFTFAGVAWLAYCYLRWLEKAAGSSVSTLARNEVGLGIFAGRLDPVYRARQSRSGSTDWDYFRRDSCRPAGAGISSGNRVALQTQGTGMRGDPTFSSA